eukprot:COSAG04_NODE_2830_length_3521_cov_1.507306_3_plen_51_part_00
MRRAELARFNPVRPLGCERSARHVEQPASSSLEPQLELRDEKNSAARCGA